MKADAPTPLFLLLYTATASLEWDIAAIAVGIMSHSHLDIVTLCCHDNIGGIVQDILQKKLNDG